MIGRLNGRNNLIDADAIGLHLRRLQVNEHLSHYAAIDVYVADAGRVLQALDDNLVGQRRELTRRVLIRDDSQIDHWLLILPVGPANERVFSLAREAWANLGDLVADFLGRRSHVSAETELSIDEADAFPRGGVNFLYTVDGIEYVFNRLDQVILNLLRRSTRIGDIDKHKWIADIGHLFDRQPVV